MKNKVLEYKTFFSKTRIITKRIFQPSYDLLQKSIFTTNNKSLIYPIIVLALIGDIFFSTNKSDLLFFGVIALFILSGFFYKISSKYTFSLCLILLSIMYVAFLFSGASEFVEKISVWIVLFMTVGIIQQWKE